MQAVAEVATLADYETVISFPPGSAGILLEPLVKVGNRAVGARVVGFAPALGEDPRTVGKVGHLVLSRRHLPRQPRWEVSQLSIFLWDRFLSGSMKTTASTSALTA